MLRSTVFLAATLSRAACARPRAAFASVRMSSSTITPIKYWALRYSYVDNMLEKRAPFRADHLAGLQQGAVGGTVALGGAFNEPCDGAVILFHSDACSKADVEDFARRDPYVTNGLVPEWSVSEYMAVTGSLHNP